MLRLSIRLCVLFTAIAQCCSTPKLLFCVITAHRPTNYLPALLAELQAQHALFKVVDTDNSTLPSLKALKLAKRPEEQNCMLPANVISCPVQKQALDVLDGLQLCLSNLQSGPRWIALLEDDMLPCEGAVTKMEQFLNSSSEGEWHSFKTARFAKYSRAVVFPLENIQPYSNYVRAHLRETPYDSLLSHREWSLGNPDYVHSVSLFAHAGKVSTIQERNDPAFMATYAAWRDEACGMPLN